jgi:hypothetical protein
MASERDFELLDDYLANKLSGDEKVAFERRMEGDPELKQEFTVQQNIVEGIKRARLAELKGMLQNTPVPAPGFGETMFAKVGAVAVVAGLIVAGVWFFTKDNHEEVVQEPAPIAEKAPDTVQPESNPEEPKIDTAEAAVEAEQATTTKDEKVVPKSAKKTKAATESVQPVKPAPVDPTEEELAESSPAVSAEQPTVDQIKEAPVRESVNSSLAIKAISDNKKLTFHYQFQDGDLMLYGPVFKDAGAYEILEFFLGKKDTTVYLYHNNKYYLLDRASTEATKLKPVEDAALIRALDDRRKK